MAATGRQSRPSPTASLTALIVAREQMMEIVHSSHTVSAMAEAYSPKPPGANRRVRKAWISSPTGRMRISERKTRIVPSAMCQPGRASGGGANAEGRGLRVCVIRCVPPALAPSA